MFVHGHYSSKWTKIFFVKLKVTQWRNDKDCYKRSLSWKRFQQLFMHWPYNTAVQAVSTCRGKESHTYIHREWCPLLKDRIIQIISGKRSIKIAFGYRNVLEGRVNNKAELEYRLKFYSNIGVLSHSYWCFSLKKLKFYSDFLF